MNNQKGFVISLVAFFILAIMLGVAVSMSAIVAQRQKMVTNAVKSTQSYYAAESGIEDSLLRLKNNPQINTLSYNLVVGQATSNVTIPALVGGSRAILAEGNTNDRIRKIETVYAIDGTQISFNYGAQVGEGGLQMYNGSRIQGNVASAGNITGSGTIDNNVVISGSGNYIQGVYVGGDALSHSCLVGASVNNLTYVTGGQHTCTVRGTTTAQSGEIPVQPMPISQSQIDEWKNEAAAGQIISGNLVTASNQTQSLGPAKIMGNLTVSNGATLNITGTVYVVGTVVVSNNSTVKLDDAYGTLNGIMMSDGIVVPANNSIFRGTNQPGSYLLVLSTNTSNAAITISNNASGSVFYTSNGGISISNNVLVKEAVGYRIVMSNNSTIAYETGLANMFFTGGPGGSWEVVSWKEK